MIIDRPTPATRKGLGNAIRCWPKMMSVYKVSKKHKLYASWRAGKWRQEGFQHCHCWKSACLLDINAAHQKRRTGGRKVVLLELVTHDHYDKPFPLRILHLQLPTCGRSAPSENVKISSTLHFREKNGSSKNIGQTTQKISHFIPNMYVSGKISALRPCTHIVRIFWNWEKNRKYLE